MQNLYLYPLQYRVKGTGVVCGTSTGHPLIQLHVTKALAAAETNLESEEEKRRL